MNKSGADKKSALLFFVPLYLVYTTPKQCPVSTGSPSPPRLSLTQLVRCQEADSMTIWKLVEQCARELTKNGISPFTRGDIINCVQRKNAAYRPDSINPIIQGLTDNLRGGAPSAVGKDILHSVGRGLFVLKGENPEHMKQLVNISPAQRP